MSDPAMMEFLRLAALQRTKAKEAAKALSKIRQDQQTPPPPKTEPSGIIWIFAIATGEYTKFINTLLHSINKNLLPNWTKYTFILTDDLHIEVNHDIGLIQIPPLKWPQVIFERYGYVEAAYQQVKETFQTTPDYILNFDIDLTIKQEINEEFLGNMIGVQSPFNIGQEAKNLDQYERRPESVCCVTPEDSKHYFSASITGGRPGPYIRMLQCAQELINQDLSNNISPKGGEESALNKLYNSSLPDKILDPSYLYLEGMALGMNEAKIISARKVEIDAQKTKLMEYQHE